MKVFVTGSKGMLGTDLVNQLKIENHDINAVDIDNLDICDLNQVIESISDYKPDVIINCAAYTNVDRCETDIDNAYRVNSIGPKNLAIVSNQLDIPLLHISTDYVFDGETNKPYIEGDVTNPQSVYGKSKLFGEENVKNFTNKYFIVRTQWLYGKNGKNFVKTMLSLAENNSSLTVVNDQFGSPTYTKDLCEVICEIIKTKAFGIYHVTNSGICSWFEFTKCIMELAGTGTGVNIQVNPCKTEEFPRPAKRPKFSPLDNFNLKLCGFKQLRHFSEALKDYLKEIL